MACSGCGGTHTRCLERKPSRSIAQDEGSSMSGGEEWENRESANQRMTESSSWVVCGAHARLKSFFRVRRLVSRPRNPPSLRVSPAFSDFAILSSSYSLILAYSPSGTARDVSCRATPHGSRSMTRRVLLGWVTSETSVAPTASSRALVAVMSSTAKARCRTRGS